MSATALIVFREVLEAALIVGIVLAATQGVPRRNAWVLLGVGLGIGGAVLVAMFAEAVSSFAAGMGQELFNAIVLFLAVCMLGWHNIWMSRAGRAMSRELKALGEAVRTESQPVTALVVVVAVAILREGSELVLFLYGIAASQEGGVGTMLLGGVIGLGLGIAAGAVVYFGLVRVAGRYLFAITGGLILFLAAGMAAQAAKFLTQAGYLPAFGHRIWDTSHLLPENGSIGSVLHVFIGYSARPDGIQVLFYVMALAVIGGLMYLMRGEKRPGAA